jgi:parallel beta-helix repeat protein
MRHKKLILFILFILLVECGLFAGWFSNALEARVVSGVFYVDAQNGDDTNPGTIEQPWQTLGKVANTGFAPGTRIRFKRGAVWDGEYLDIAAQGAENAPIVYEAYGTGNPPKIQNGAVALSGAQYAIVRNFEVTGSPYAGIALQDGTHHTQILSNTLHDNAGGIWTGNDVGMSNRMAENSIYLNQGNGIAIDSVFCTPGNETVIAYNEIYSNAWHGIELSGNYHIVENNVVYSNGANPDGTDDLVGHSGIHLFSRFHEGDPDMGGDHNIIRNNIVYDTRDRNDDATDGNGIQMDMWCDDNLVYNNIAYHNDGPGITIFGGSRNRIFNNTLYDNGLHLGYRWAKTQLMVGSSEEVAAADNAITNNIAFSTDEETFAVFIEDTSQPLDNVFAANLYFNAAGGNLTGRGSEGAVSLSEWNRMDWADDLEGNPLFMDAATWDFHLSSASPAIDTGRTVSWLLTDLDGNPRPCPAGGNYDIGVYELCNIELYLPVTLCTPQ